MTKTLRILFGITLAIYSSSLTADSLDFREAQRLVEAQNHPLQAAAANRQMRLAEAWQAGFLPNPLFSFETDQFGGSHYYRGFNNAEYTWSLTQPFELGGKRSARIDLALAEVYRACWDYEAIRQNAHRDMEEAFIHAAALQEHVKNIAHQHEIAKRLLDFSTEKATAGKIPVFHQKRVLMACQTSHFIWQKTLADRDASLIEISSRLGGCARIDAVDYPFFSVFRPYSLCTYEKNLENNPELASLRLGTYASLQVHRLERANRIPDLDVTASITQDSSERDHYFTLGFSIPLPIFNQNQGNVCSSSWQTRQSAHREDDLERVLLKDLTIAHRRFVQAYETICSLKASFQECAMETLEAAEEEYRLGKIELRELLEAQKASSEMNDYYIEALKEYHLRRLEVENIAPSYEE